MIPGSKGNRMHYFSNKFSKITKR